MVRLLLACLLLSSCTSQSSTDDAQARIISSSSSVRRAADRSSVKPKVLEKFPSERSVAYFGSMLLEGKDLNLERVMEQNAAYVKHAVSYRSNGLKITGVFLIPKGKGPFPLVIFNHGYIDPKVYTQGRGLKREQDYLARQGFAVLHTDYRKHAGSDPDPDTSMVYDAGLAYSMDSANAILAVRAAKLPAVDASKVGMLGHSMGGGVSLNIAVARPDLVNAFVLYAPVHSDAWMNFDRWHADRVDAGEKTLAALRTREFNPSGWDALSSKPLLKNITAPIMLFQGTRDKDVPSSWSDDLNSYLTAEKKQVEYVVYPNEGHEFAVQWSDFMKRTAAFLKTHLTNTVQ